MSPSIPGGPGEALKPKTHSQRGSRAGKGTTRGVLVGVPHHRAQGSTASSDESLHTDKSDLFTEEDLGAGSFEAVNPEGLEALYA